jgi:hypothetical protein
MEFNQKWLGTTSSEEQLLGTSDLQSLADLGNSITVVREMRAVPFGRDDVARLLIATVAPFLPLLLTIMPLEELMTQVFKMLL